MANELSASRREVMTRSSLLLQLFLGLLQILRRQEARTSQLIIKPSLRLSLRLLHREREKRGAAVGLGFDKD